MKAEPPSTTRSPLGALIDRLRDLVGRRAADPGTLRATLEELIEDEEEETGRNGAGFSAEERELLRKALAFGELEVGDVMVPRTDIRAVELGTPLGEVVAAMRAAMHTRLIVFRETLDDVVGMVHIKDLLAFWGDGQDFRLESVVRDVLPIPASMPIIDLLLRMKATRVHMAIVVDEYGGTDGLVTLEDVVEELVGELNDEHDPHEPPQLVEVADGSLEADARIDIEDLEERLGLQLIDDERREYINTLGGLLFALVDRVPARGEVVHDAAEAVAFEVIEADPRRVKRIRIRRLAPAAGAAGPGP